MHKQEIVEQMLTTVRKAHADTDALWDYLCDLVYDLKTEVGS